MKNKLTEIFVNLLAYLPFLHLYFIFVYLNVRSEIVIFADAILIVICFIVTLFGFVNNGFVLLLSKRIKEISLWYRKLILSIFSTFLITFGVAMEAGFLFLLYPIIAIKEFNILTLSLYLIAVFFLYNDFPIYLEQRHKIKIIDSLNIFFRGLFF